MENHREENKNVEVIPIEPVKRGRGRPKGSKAKPKICPKCGTVVE